MPPQHLIPSLPSSQDIRTRKRKTEGKHLEPHSSSPYKFGENKDVTSVMPFDSLTPYTQVKNKNKTDA
jgi:hypothetical protein